MMTEQVNNEVSNQNLSVAPQTSAPNNATAAPAPALNTPSQDPAKRVYYDQDVDRIAQEKKADGHKKGYGEGYEAAKREYLAQSQNQTAQPYSPQPQSFAQAPQTITQQQVPYQQTAPAYVPPGANVEDIRRTVIEEFQREQQKQYYDGLANQFVAKFDASKSEIENLDQIREELNLPTIPAIWMTAGQFDKPAVILKELWNDPVKLATLNALSNSPALLKREMQKMYDGIQRNVEAEKSKASVANAPLSRQKPSTVGIDSGRDKADLKSSDYRALLRV